MHSIQLREKVVSLRKTGHSLKEISEILGLSKSTVSDWVSSIQLSKTAQERLKQKRILGQYRSVVVKRMKRNEQLKITNELAIHEIQMISHSKQLWKLYTALLWWCEGNKDTTMLRFTNSDPTLIQNFLHSLRSGFIINESKFRVLTHIHEYHSDEDQKKFWSETTGIPLKQFHVSYKKPNTGRRYHTNYQGCIAVSYYDAKIAKELAALYNAFTLSRGIR